MLGLPSGGQHKYCVSFISVFFDRSPFPLLEVAEPSDKLNKKAPVQILAKLVEHKEVPQGTRPDERLNLSFLATCLEVPELKMSEETIVGSCLKVYTQKCVNFAPTTLQQISAVTC